MEDKNILDLLIEIQPVASSMQTLKEFKSEYAMGVSV